MNLTFIVAWICATIVVAIAVVWVWELLDWRASRNASTLRDSRNDLERTVELPSDPLPGFDLWKIPDWVDWEREMTG